MKKYGLLCLTALMILLGALLFTACSEKESDGKPIPKNAVSVVKNGETEYRIVRPDFPLDDAEGDALIRLHKAILEATGCDMEGTTDYYNTKSAEEAEAAEAACEILIGRTNRTASSLIPESLAENEYVLLRSGNKIVIAGGSDAALAQAVEKFLADYLFESKKSLLIPASLSVDATVELPPTVYLISDIKTVGTGNQWNDIVRLVSSLQGLMNRDAEETDTWLFQSHGKWDTFWLNYISGDGKMMDGFIQKKIGSWKDFWAVFGEEITERGLVVWDPDAPATANVAATICGVDGTLPVRYSEDKNSLYAWLIAKGVPVRTDLSGMFDGTGTIPGTSIPSTGSVKCDPYLWALEKYGDKCAVDKVAYVLDGASCVETNRIYRDEGTPSPEVNQLYHHDYYIYCGCFFFDLTCVADEAPCDDPDQPMGTDAATLEKILTFFEKRNAGNMTTLMGFPPWYMKYSTEKGYSRMGSVSLEHKFAVTISKHNFLMEADGKRPSANTSVYSQYVPTVTTFEIDRTPKDVTFDENTRYFTTYMGDYDCAAWMMWFVPEYFADRAHGSIPLTWGFNPNLYDRIPMVFDYVYENRSENDYIITGDSGAGYVTPGALTDLDAWVTFNQKYLGIFGMDMVGFLLNETDYALTPELMAAYAQFAPKGAFYKAKSKDLIVYNDETVFMYLQSGIPLGEAGAYETIYNYEKSTGTNFFAFRTVLKSPSLIKQSVEEYIEYANAKDDGYTYVYVDPYTLFDLVLQSGQGKRVSAESAGQ